MNPAPPRTNRPTEPTAAAEDRRNLARLWQEAVLLWDRGHAAESESRCRTILAQLPTHVGAWHLLGVHAVNSGHITAAIDFLRRSIELDSLRPAAHEHLGLALCAAGKYAESITSFDRALELAPANAELWNQRGMTLQQLGRFDEALRSFDNALQLRPLLAAAHHNRGVALLGLGRRQESLESLDRALQIEPQFAAALNCRATVLLDLQRPREALTSLDAALGLQPDFLDAIHNRGNAYKHLGRFKDAIDEFDRVLRLRPDFVPSIADKGTACVLAGWYALGADCFSMVVAHTPTYPYSLGELAYCRGKIGDWSGVSELESRLIAGVARGERVAHPHSFLAITDKVELQRRCAEIWTAHVNPPTPRSYSYVRGAGQRIRVAYLSSDFREHAVSYLLAGVFERHDRSRFEVIGIGTARTPTDGYGQRVRVAFDAFIDGSELDDAMLADRIHTSQIDILVDLNGHTQGQRTAVLAMRPAPVQVNFLGYPGTMGAAYVDYLLADHFLIPPDTRALYQEQIAYLPECFQANDERRPRESKPRDERGPSDRGLVLACFNQLFKVSEAYFAIWMRTLRAAPNCRLCLLAEDAEIRARLGAAARRHGVEPERLQFVQRVPYPDHLARLALADLCLDTGPFGGGTTTSDALWVGVPVLTCPGEAFASRMSASLLSALGLTDLIAADLGDYERRLLELITKPAALLRLRAALEAARSDSPVFDSRRYTLHLEAAYHRMHEIRLAGAAPATFSVEALPPMDPVDFRSVGWQ